MMAKFFVDPQGDDSKDGKSESSAWKTLEKAGAAALLPGDSLLFKRGGIWTGFRRAFPFVYSGTPGAPITIGAYGNAAARPTILLDANGTAGEQQGFVLLGSYLNVNGLRVSLIHPYRSPIGIESDGQNVKLGWYVGFSVSGHHVMLDDCEQDHLALGVFLQDTSHHCRVLRMYTHDLDTFWRVDGAAGAMGAIALVVHGDDHEVAYNKSVRNWATCRRIADNSEQSYGAPFEIYNANRSWFHHNEANEFRKSFEMGRDPDKTCDDNILEYNVFVSSRDNARGPNIHGTAAFGPVRRTKVRHNTVILTGLGSEALIANAGATGTEVVDNILSALGKAIYIGAGAGTEHHNLFGVGQVQLVNQVMSPTSRKAYPLLDTIYAPLSGSPAIGMASDGGTVGARLGTGEIIMAVITELEEAVVSLRAQAVAMTAAASVLAAQADAMAATLAALKVANDQINAATATINSN